MYQNEMTKDFRKGGKDASKAIHKMDNPSKDDILDLMDSAYTRTQNTEYLSGFCDVCRQAIACNCATA